MMSPKELKKLAAACRAAGIKHYKSEGIEFTLTDEVPSKPSKKPHVPTSQTSSVEETNSLSDEDMMFWSTGPAEILGN